MVASQETMLLSPFFGDFNYNYPSCASHVFLIFAKASTPKGHPPGKKKIENPTYFFFFFFFFNTYTPINMLTSIHRVEWVGGGGVTGNNCIKHLPL